MKTIIYAGSEFTTGDEIADALLEYSESLGQMNTAETVEIPVLRADGSTMAAKFLVGPASQIVATSLPRTGPELEAPELVERLRNRAESQRMVARARDTAPDGDPTEWNGLL